MQKDLSEMTLQELWQLFPIILTEHQAVWKSWFEEEAAALSRLLGGAVFRLSHIGSTAIPGIQAKPIIDILLEMEDENALAALPPLVARAGYRCMSRSEQRLSFNRGYTPRGFARQVFHLHARRMGDNDELYFRDYLRDHPEAAGEYEALKLGLWKQYEHDRDGYTAAKAAFVQKYTQLAKQALPGRYAR